ncbi:hypothetical protein ACG9YX_12610 [Acinetobacter nematophilus]|uniref:hypothetical protein n=1 Tax=Acinetobacter nematophilus TaxID=2994642 RepID=UPI003AF7EE0F
MKKILITMAMIGLGSIANAAGGMSSGPNLQPWSPWYLYQSNLRTYEIECVYKRERMGPNGGYRDVETQRLVVARYPFGKCPSTIQ